MIVFALVILATTPDAVAISKRVEKSGSATLTASFSDVDGQHRIIFREHAEVRKKDLRSKKLTVVHESRNSPNGQWIAVWEAKDFVNDCEFDLALALNDASISITDLDSNGRAEVSFLYRLGCRSDVSPLTKKLLLYEGKTKYALRGLSRVQVGQTEDGKAIEEGGTHEVDPGFAAAPAAFLEHAQGQWARFSRD